MGANLGHIPDKCASRVIAAVYLYGRVVSDSSLNSRGRAHPCTHTHKHSQHSLARIRNVSSRQRPQALARIRNVPQPGTVANTFIWNVPPRACKKLSPCCAQSMPPKTVILPYCNNCALFESVIATLTVLFRTMPTNAEMFAGKQSSDSIFDCQNAHCQKIWLQTTTNSLGLLKNIIDNLGKTSLTTWALFSIIRTLSLTVFFINLYKTSFPKSALKVRSRN